MNAVSRRVFLYWLLLLLPALTVGAGALWLLRREGTRIDERARAADAARRAAMEARTRLIAENIEVIISEVQSGLMNTLNEAPDTSPAAFLAEWKRANPLVRDVFQASGAGHLLWGNASDATLAWLATAPWRRAVAGAAPAMPSSADELAGANNFLIESDTAATVGISKESAIVSGNVAQLNVARNELQEIARVQSRADTKIASVAKSMEAKSIAPSAISEVSADALVPPMSSPSSAVAAPAPAPRPTGQTGWTPWSDASGKPHLHGWRLCENGTVLVVEIDIAAIAARLRDVLPAAIDPNESYAIGEMGKPPAHVVGRLDARSGPPHNLMLPVSTLPGWAVYGWVAREAGGAGGARGFFLLSALLTGLFVIAIIGGGSLLLRQARISAAESAQKTSFVANVSHEFKTPLTTIRLYSELLEEGRIRDESKRAESLRTISRETQRLARLVNNVLDFSRLEQGRKKFDLAEYDLREEIARILDRHAPRIAEAGLRLDLLRADAPCVVKTDLDAVEQIVINLLDNACKYAASGGEVTVTVKGASRSPRREPEAPDAFATITVADRGPGIPSSHREKIFEKFHRVDDKLTAPQGGAGLGLGIARQLARGLGGDLTYSPREGGGSEFTLTLRVS